MKRGAGRKEGQALSPSRIVEPLTLEFKRHGIGVIGMAYSVDRDEIIARQNDYQLIEWVS